MPSRKYFTDKVIPEMHDQIKKRIAELISEAITVTSMSFTADTWTSNNTIQSYFGLTAHWLTEDFKRKSAVLHCSPVQGQHTAANLQSTFLLMMEQWNIARDHFHVLVRDNAANMVKAFKDAKLESIGCFSHTLQLCIKDGLFAQRAVSDVIAISRSLVGHFKHSSSASDRLKELQAELGLPQHKLIQDVTTRWNSSYYMLNRLVEQRRAVAVFCTEVASVTGPSANQWLLMENVVATLRPFEEITKEICRSDASVSVIIPTVKALSNLLKKEGCDSGIKTMKATLLEAVQSRFAKPSPTLIISTVLDPRFKLRCFEEAGDATVTAAIVAADNETTREIAKAEVLLAVTRSLAGSTRTANVEVEVVGTESTTDSDNTVTSQDESDDGEPSTKKICKRQEEQQAQVQCSIWGCFDEMLSTGDSSAGSAAIRNDADGTAELNQYLTEPLLSHKDDPAVWWQMNRLRFPLLANVARSFLGAPPTSVPSERLFSTAGDVISDHRSTILPENAEKLIFLKCNIPLMDGQWS